MLKTVVKTILKANTIQIYNQTTYYAFQTMGIPRGWRKNTTPRPPSIGGLLDK